MALEGTFKDFHIADILQLIGLQRKSGMLTLEGEEDTLSLTFQDGAVVWVQSTRVPWEQRLAGPLLARGLPKPGPAPGALRPPEGRVGPLSAESVLMEGIRRVDEWPMIRERVPSTAMVFKVGSRATKLTPRNIEPGEGKMLDLVGGQRTVP